MYLKRQKIKKCFNTICLVLCFWIFFHTLRSESMNVSLTSRASLAKFPANGTGERKNMKSYFNFTQVNSICSRYKNSVAIIPVYSAAGNIKRRQAIRDTLGKNCIGFRCKLFFIIGATKNKTLINKLQNELKQHQDILVINKIDTYRDLNNKAVAMLDWLIKFCPQPKYVIHIIDDTYPDIKYFIEQMSSMPLGGYFLGEVVTGAEPIRDTSHKWFVSRREYPFMYYPRYIKGVAYGFLNHNSRHLRNVLRDVENMWIEDVWFTGIVAKKANFKLISPTKSIENEPNDKVINANIWDYNFCVHNVDVNMFYKIYNLTS